MTKDELIVSQQLKIAEYEKMLAYNQDLKLEILGKFYNIGAPLNDNVLEFNRDQIAWAFSVVHLAEDIETLNYECDD